MPGPASRRRRVDFSGVRAIAFDAYGTVIDFHEGDFVTLFAELLAHQGLEGDAGQLWRHFLRAAYQLRSENHHWPAYTRFVAAWARQFEIAFRRLGLPGDPLAAAQYIKRRLADAPADPQAAPVLDALRGRYPVALLSNADDDFLLECLERNGLRFDLVVTSERAGALKPDPAIFQRLLEELNLPAESVLYVGDQPIPDVLGARRAGLRVVWLDRAGRRRPRQVPPPDLRLRSLSELLPHLVPDHA